MKNKLLRNILLTSMIAALPSQSYAQSAFGALGQMSKSMTSRIQHNSLQSIKKQEKQYKNEPFVGTNQMQSLQRAQRAWSYDMITADCGCQYNLKTGPNSGIMASGCGFAQRQKERRPAQPQWSRVIPLERLSLGRSCAAGAQECHDSDGKALFGAACCMIIDPQFQRLANDAWNWIPMVDEIAKDKGDDIFQDLAKGVSPYGNCSVKIDPERGGIEPSDREKGVIARVSLYYAKVWNVPFTPSQIDMYNKWNQDHPPTQNEKERAATLNQIQNFTNPYYPHASHDLEQNLEMEH